MNNEMPNFNSKTGHDEDLDIDEKESSPKRYNPETMHNPQGHGETISLTQEEINKVESYINSGTSIYQSGFDKVHISREGEQGNVSIIIHPQHPFSGNVLEYIDNYSEEIYKNTGIRFCYSEKHNPPSETMKYIKAPVAQFELVPKHAD